MKSNRERLIECITCKKLETCNDDANAKEDEEGHCVEYEVDPMFEGWKDE